MLEAYNQLLTQARAEAEKKSIQAVIRDNIGIYLRRKGPEDLDFRYQENGGGVLVVSARKWKNEVRPTGHTHAQRKIITRRMAVRDEEGNELVYTDQGRIIARADFADGSTASLDLDLPTLRFFLEISEALANSREYRDS